MKRPRRFPPPPPDDAEHITGNGITILTSAEDRGPYSIWYDFRQSVSPEARARHEQTRALALAKPECGPHAAVVIDLWSGRAWKSADEFVAAVAAATQLPAKKAEREARK